MVGLGELSGGRVSAGRAELSRVWHEVAARVKSFGPPTENGTCLLAAACGCAALTKRGFKAVFQAGACYHRRLPPGMDPDREVFGFAWEPEHPHSVALMAEGFAPEFHAWCGVVPAAGSEGLPACGVVVDFAADQLPRIAHGAGMQWLAPAPPSPFVAPASDCCDTGSGYYLPVKEASLVIGLLGRAAVAGLAGEGHDVADLWAVFGGSPRRLGGLRDWSLAIPDAKAALHFMRSRVGVAPEVAGVW